MENYDSYLDEVLGTVQEAMPPAVFKQLIKRWRIIVYAQCTGSNLQENYRNLSHLKLTIQWMEKQSSLPKDKNGLLQSFLCHLVHYIDIELRFLRIHYPETASLSGIDKSEQLETADWTGSKRSLMELICSLGETDCINNGKSSTQKLVVLFEAFFNVSLENYHSEINKMSARKPPVNSESRAYFLQKLAGKFDKKLSQLE